VNDHARSTPSRRIIRAYVSELRALDGLADATQRLANAEALSRFFNNFPNEELSPTQTRR
jgi:hypothetical protein